MNKHLLVILFIALFAMIDAQSKVRLSRFYETMCVESTCQEKCSANGYNGGVCKAGDLIMFCICDECHETKCLESCQKDKYNGLCNFANGSKGECVCN